MKQLLLFLKPVLTAVLVVSLLQITGLAGNVSAWAQYTAMQVGFLEADVLEDSPKPAFNYDFNIKDLKGNRISFTNYKNKVIFINLWATWCGPCKAEMPGIQSLYDKVKDNENEIAFVMLSLDKDHELSKIENYLAKNAYSFPVFQPSGYLTEQLDTPSIPTTFIVSKEGKVILKTVGSRNYDTKKIIDLLKAEAAK